MIKIICVGKIKEQYFTDAIKEYLKRLSKYVKIQIVELPDYNYDINKTLLEEGKNILKQIGDRDFVVTLEIGGSEFCSTELSSFIDNNIHRNLVFIIGGSNGLSSIVKERSNQSLSFSKMTFPHQLFRTLLLEQIYRSFKIINNENYHK